MVGGLLFDFDGTLLDTETPIYEVWCEIYSRAGVALNLETWERSLGTHGSFDPCAQLARLTGRAQPDEALRRTAREEIRRRCAGQTLLPGVGERLAEARDLGLKTAVASSSSAAWVEGWLEHFGVRSSFDAVVARDHVARVKPAPDLFLQAAARLEIAPAACIVFEDTPNGARAAQAAGMRCVAVPSGLTARLAFPQVDLTLGSLAERPLEVILEQLAPGWNSEDRIHRDPGNPAAAGTSHSRR